LGTLREEFELFRKGIRLWMVDEKKKKKEKIVGCRRGGG